MAACLATLQTWGCDPLYADGSLPSPGVYGIPGQWPQSRKRTSAQGSNTAAGWRSSWSQMWVSSLGPERAWKASRSDGRSASTEPD